MDAPQQEARRSIWKRNLKYRVTLVALAALLVIAGFMAASSKVGQQRLLSEIDANAIAYDQTLFEALLKKHFQRLENQLTLALRLEEIPEAFAIRDREGLEIGAVPAYDLMHARGNFTRMSFYVDPGVAFFRAHDPIRHGDRVTPARGLVEEALQNKQARMGLEADGNGAHLFVVQPIFREGGFLGLVEVGGDLQPVLDELKETLGSEAAIILLRGSTSSPQAQDQSAWDVLAATDESLLNRTRKRVDFARGLETEHRISHKDGHRTLATTLFAFRDFRGKSIGVVAVSSNVTAFSATMKRTLLRSIGIAAAGFALAAGLIFFTLDRNFRPLSRMVHVLKDIAEGDGDLTQRIDVHSEDEIQEVARWMNSFMANLQSMVSQVKDTVKTVSTVARQITASTDTISTGLLQQEASISEIVQSMDTVDQTAHRALASMSNLALNTEEASSSVLQMSASIDEVAQNTTNSSAAVEQSASSITQMVQSIDEISGHINALSASADQTSASMEQISRSIEAISDNAKESSESSREAVAKAQSGNASVVEVHRGMEKIQTTFDESAHVMERLGKQSASIGKILKVIDEVADQTNLLALNASIIAAQAGEHGKGFAVVADEIKALAERSASASREIYDVVRNVQTESASAGKSMKVSATTITQGLALSQQAAEALKEITESVGRSGNMIQDIARATVEQSKGSQSVRDAVADITQALRRMADGTDQQRVGSEQIVTSTERLREMIVHVSRAMQEQSRGSGQISKSIEEINTKTQQISKSTAGQSEQSQQVLLSVKTIEQVSEGNARQIQEMTAATQQLSDTVACLQSDVDRFQV
jgi:methyl-accepting chemotaxis protein